MVPTAKPSVKGFLRDFDWAVEQFYAARGRPFENFLHGASAHFHQRAIAVVRQHAEPPSRWAHEPAVIELLYATLAAWGMDSQKARLVDFAPFADAVRGLVDGEAFRAVERRCIREVDGSWEERLRLLWEDLAGPRKIMMGESILVGSSKLLHHLLPDLFPPIDRRYTLAFLAHLDPRDGYRPVRPQRPDFPTFLTAMRFFGRVARDVPAIDQYLGRGLMSGSIPKVVDNAVIGWWGAKFPRRARMKGRAESGSR